MASCTPAAYLQAFGDSTQQRLAVAQLHTESSRLAVETVQHEGSERVDRVCQQCSSLTVIDTNHIRSR